MKEKVCGVTGHREIPAEYMEQAEQGLLRESQRKSGSAPGGSDSVPQPL